MREKEHSSLALGRSWKRFVPETLGLLLALLTLDKLTFAGDRFAAIAPHPFWIIVLLAATQYGVLAGVFAAAAASIALYAGALPARTPEMDFYDYAAALTWQPAQWWAGAILFGGLRALHLHNAAQTEAKLAEAVSQAKIITEAFKRARAEVARLEARIAADATRKEARVVD